MNIALWIYRRLAQAFPHEFKLVYGSEITQLGEDVIDDIAKRHGILGLIRLLLDIIVRLPVEYLSEMRQDLRYACRRLIKSPGFAFVGIVSMGIGMGLTTFVYSSKMQLFLRTLPAAANASCLAMDLKPVPYYYIEQYRNQKSLLSGAAAFQIGIPFNITFRNEANTKPERVFGQLVSADYFSVVGVQPQLGRMLSPDIDKPGDAPVVVISDRFWRNRLNSSPDAIGETISVNGQPATIIGITPQDFNGVLPLNPSEVFVPITSPAALAPELAGDVLHDHNARDFFPLFCLAPGVTTESAEAGLDAITHNLDQQQASASVRDDKGRRVTLLAAGTMVPIPKNVRPVVFGFFIVLIGLIMTIACMNLANMLLARGANRQKELAIRVAIGASRFRIIRQMLTEGILLSLLGGVAGFVLACGLCVANSKFKEPSAIPFERDFTPDWQVAILVFALAVICGIGFSLLPALRSTRVDLVSALKEGSMLRIPGYWRFGLRNLLMVSQIAGSLMLLLITGVLVIGISTISSIQTKFDPSEMYLLSIDPMRQGYTPEKSVALFENLPERLKSDGGIRSIAIAAQAPFSIQDEDDPTPLTAEDTRVQVSCVKEIVGANYFAALGEGVLAGREFADADQRTGFVVPPSGARLPLTQPNVSKTVPVVLNESAAHGFFGRNNAIGKRLRDDDQSYEVIGVIRNLSNGLGVKNVIYLPLSERNFARPPADGITVMIRPEKGAAGTDALGRIRREIASIDPNLTIFNVRTLKQYLDVSRSAERFSVNTYAGIGVFGLVLAAVGLAGLTAYTVAQRRKEIGIRMALGATKAQVLRFVLREGTALVSIGTVLGFLGAYALAKVISAAASELVDSLNIGTDDPRLLIGAPLLLASLAMLSCYLPARRAAKIDPLEALRNE